MLSTDRSISVDGDNKLIDHSMDQNEQEPNEAQPRLRRLGLRRNTKRRKKVIILDEESSEEVDREAEWIKMLESTKD